MDPYLEHPALWPDVHNSLIVDLNTLLHSLYDRARFDLQIDYSKPPVPPLNDADAEWAQSLLNPTQ